MPLVFNFLSKKRELIHSLVKFPAQFIYHNDYEMTSYNCICSNEIDRTMKKLITQAILMIFGALSAYSGAVYSSFVLGVKTTTTETKIPFVDENSTVEFYLNLLLQTTIVSHAFFLFVGIEIMMLIFANVAPISPKLIQNEFEQLREMEKLSKIQLRLTFRNIVAQSLDFDR